MNLLARRVIQLVVVLIVVTFFTALLVSMLPGDPAEVIIPFGSNQQRQALRHDLHLDDPITSQYANWVTNFAKGDLGHYYGVSDREPVWDRVKTAWPVSVQLMVYAQVLALVFAIPLGIFTAYRAGSLFDKATNATMFGFLAIPNFALALVLAYYLGVKLDWFPVAGYVKPSVSLTEHFKSMFLPAVSLAIGQIAVYMRLLRSDMIATLQEDFITMAKAKGMSANRILWRHALRPSSLTLLTVAGLNVGTLIGGAVIIEVIFTLPGMGLLTAQAIAERQYVALQSLVALLAIAYIVVNFAVDLLYAVLDPRIRHARSAV